MIGHLFTSITAYEGDLEEGGKARFALGRLKRTEESLEEPAILMQVIDGEGTEVVNYALTTASFWVMLELMMSCFAHVPEATPEEKALELPVATTRPFDAAETINLKQPIVEDDARPEMPFTPEPIPIRLDHAIEAIWKIYNRRLTFLEITIALAECDQMLPIGTAVIYRFNNLDQSIELDATVVAHDEGWYELQFKDDSTATVRPSRVFKKE